LPDLKSGAGCGDGPVPLSGAGLGRLTTPVAGVSRPGVPDYIHVSVESSTTVIEVIEGEGQRDGIGLGVDKDVGSTDAA